MHKVVKKINDEKLKVYLDTSVISYLKQDDVPIETEITNKLWEKFKSGIYDIYISQVTIAEINRCKEEKLKFCMSKLDEIEYTRLMLDDATYDLAEEIVRTGLLTEKSSEDCQHIVVAVLNNCDIIVSWNFKHLVNVKTNRGVRKITELKGYKDIEIIEPNTLLQMEV